MESGISAKTFRNISLLWWLLIVGSIVFFYLYTDDFNQPFFSLLKAIPVAAGILLYYYGHQYLINHYLLHNDNRRYAIFLLSLLVVQSVGSYNINHFLWMANPAEAGKFYNQFSFFFGVSLMFDLCTFMGILTTINALTIRRKLEAVQTEHQKIRTVFLRGQINHHSLLNTMNSIYYLSITNQSATSDAILKASDLMKYILVQTEKETVRLSDELKFIHSYIELQKLRLGNTRQISYTLTGTDAPYVIPPMLLITLVENAFKYAATTITIAINIQQDKLELECANDVMKATTDSHGIGLKNLEERLNLIYGEDYLFKTVEANGLYRAYLKIRLFYD
jgi:signal transduction histidine kinase